MNRHWWHEWPDYLDRRWSDLMASDHLLGSIHWKIASGVFSFGWEINSQIGIFSKTKCNIMKSPFPSLSFDRTIETTVRTTVIIFRLNLKQEPKQPALPSYQGDFHKLKAKASYNSMVFLNLWFYLLEITNWFSKKIIENNCVFVLL